MATVYMMVGLPGSGKSTLAKDLCEKVFSSDAIRGEIYGDESNQSDPQKVFRILHKRVKDCLREGVDCVYDATNMSAKRRAGFLSELRGIDCRKICVMVATPIEVCKQRNQLRERKVPDLVIDRMVRQFDTPMYWEGWNNIILHREKGFENYYGTVDTFLKDYSDFDQENSHHSTTLGEHCRLTREYILNHYQDPGCWLVQWIADAAALHDCGKISTKVFKDGDSDAHYYSHDHVGAYDCFFYGKTSEISIDESELMISALIRYHMEPYFWEKNPDIAKKWLKRWSNEFPDILDLLHQADRQAH